MGQTIKKIKRWFWRKKQTTKGVPMIANEDREKWRDIAIRAGKTFLQAFLANLLADASGLTGGWNVIRAALISAAAAGISAVMNFILKQLESGDDDAP